MLSRTSLSQLLLGFLEATSCLALRLPLEFRASNSLDGFIAQQRPISLQGALANIGDAGAKCGGASPGVVIASPTVVNPNYDYTWTRDGALTLKMIIDSFIQGQCDLQPVIQEYISASAQVQILSNPSGDLSTGGLGEAKFYSNLTAWTGAWGRPQRDGPALRASAIIAYAQWLISNGYESTASDVLWPIISNDLSYVQETWNQTGFDLWEEVKGSSFFAIAVQHRSLVEGAALAKQLGKTCDGCASQAPQILCFMQSFWNGDFVVANLNQNNGRSGKDANTLLASVHTFDPDASCDSSGYQPCSDRALANHKAVVDSFRTLYPINSGINSSSAVAVGRYSEDVYMTGMPWYLTTSAAAELLYDALYQWNQQGQLEVTSTSMAFFQQFSSSIASGSYSSSSSTYKTLTAAIKDYADGFLSIVQKYTPDDGSLSEQFDKNSGVPISALDLTWSYSAFITATNKRLGIMPASWNASAAAQVPDQCSASSAQGTYVAATNTAFPPSQTRTAGPTCLATCTPVATPSVLFNEYVETVVGESIFISGSTDQLGTWDPNRAVALSADHYVGESPLWEVVLPLPAGQEFEYKFLKKTQDGNVVWENDPNRSYKVPTTCSNKAQVNSFWQ